MYIKYGSYQHPDGAANLISFSVRPRYSARKFKLANVVTAHVEGTLKLNSGEDQYDTSTDVQALIDALDVDGQDFGLYHDDDTPTPHFMDSSDSLNMTGNQVKYLTFPSSHNGEYSTGRDFKYAIEAEYRSSNSVIMDYQETITHIGTTGPHFTWRTNKYHQPYYTLTEYSTFQHIVQEGYAVTLLTWLHPPNPILGLPYYIPRETKITRTGPKRYPQGFEGYLVRWRHVFKTPTVAPVLPSIR